MPDQIIITLPLPTRIVKKKPNGKTVTYSLSPNSRTHWAVKKGLTKKYRHDAYMMTIAAGGQNLKWERAQATPIFYFLDRRRRDIDNLPAQLKPAFDGIVDAGAIVDDSSEHLEHGRPIMEIDRNDPRVEIVLKKL